MREYATHLPALCGALSKWQGPLLELGAGEGSTPFLSHYARMTGYPLLTLEQDAKWLETFRPLAHDKHMLLLCPEDPRESPAFREWRGAVALVDFWPSLLRGPVLEALKGRAECVVCHDTQPEDAEYYGWTRAFEMWAHRKEYTTVVPHTTILWDADPSTPR